MLGFCHRGTECVSSGRCKWQVRTRAAVRRTCAPVPQQSTQPFPLGFPAPPQDGEPKAAALVAIYITDLITTNSSDSTASREGPDCTHTHRANGDDMCVLKTDKSRRHKGRKNEDTNDKAPLEMSHTLRQACWGQAFYTLSCSCPPQLGAVSAAGFVILEHFEREKEVTGRSK